MHWTAAKAASVACHEIGHAVGLTHYNVYTDSCMVQHLDTNNVPQGLSLHDIGHLNAWY